MQEHIEAVRRMQDYIAEHLFEEITLADMARVSLFSPWYAHRLFTQTVELKPAEYIRKLRLSKSALRLRDNPGKIADIAFEMGFGSVDGYQRAFLESLDAIRESMLQVLFQYTFSLPIPSLQE